MIHRAFQYILLPVALVLVPAGAAYAQRPGVPEKAEAGLLAQQEKTQRLSRGIEEKNRIITDSTRKEIELLATLDRLEHQLKADRGRLMEMQKKIEEQESRIADNQRVMNRLLGEQQELGQQVQQRLAAYYRLGETGLINVLFSASSLPELLDLEEYLKRLLYHDRQMIFSFREKIAEVRQAANLLGDEKMHLSALRAELEDQEQSTAAAGRNLAELLKMVQTEKKLNQVAVQEMEKAARQLTATLEKPGREAPSVRPGDPALKKSPPPSGRLDFIARKGSLPPPVAGTVISVFGEKIAGRYGIVTESTGIGIKTEPGAQIRAIHDGSVLYAGYLRGYGNLLIIDHGDQFYSLMSRAENFFMEKDARVQAGQVVGVMGDHSQLPEGGLHFEIRHGSAPQDPLAWLEASRLVLATKKIRHDLSSFRSTSR